MATLTITRATGEVSTHEITPVMEVAFESWFQGGLVELYTKSEKQTYKYWLAHFALKEDKVQVPPFGDEFLRMVKKVKVDFGDEPDPNG
jgi:hypothetical protein